MKHLAQLAASGLLIAACSSASAESSTRDDCMVMVSDPVAQEQFEKRDFTSEGYCGCVTGYVDALPEEDEAQIRVALAGIADEMEASDHGAKEAVGALMGQAGDMDQSAGDQMRAGLSHVREMMQKFGEDFEGGDACPTPS